MTLTCLNCRKTFVGWAIPLKYGGPPAQVWCSNACSKEYSAVHYRTSRHCYWCGVDFHGYHGSKFCSGACRVAAHRSGKPLPKGERKERRPPLLKLRFHILERDHFRCTYCGRSAQDKAELHVDHINPKAKGGLWIEENLTTACRECNLGKSDAILTFRSSSLQSVSPAQG